MGNVMVDGVMYTWCDACGERTPCTQQEEYGLPDFGLSVKLFGYYGGFADSVDIEAHVCHDCAAVLWTLLAPKEAKRRGHHPNCIDDGEWCCDYSFKVSDEAIR